MNLTSLISKSAKSLALLAMLAAMPMAASAEEMAKTPASQITYEPQLDNQRDPNPVSYTHLTLPTIYSV